MIHDSIQVSELELDWQPLSLPPASSSRRDADHASESCHWHDRQLQLETGGLGNSTAMTRLGAPLATPGAEPNPESQPHCQAKP